MSTDGDYCAFTKAVEHLGDRWSLVIIRELALHDTLGFNALAEDGTTRVELEHSGLDHHGPSWRRLRDAISAPRGWQLHLRRFALAAQG